MTPRPAATLIVLRPGEGGPEILMLERSARGFFGGLWVFPGGALEPIDQSDLARRSVSAPEGADDHRWRAAALRETVEEVGLALTDPPRPETIDAVGAAVFQSVLDRDAVLDGRRLRLLSRWITPAGLPTRFDARFYLTVTQVSPPLRARPGEVADLAWVTAGEGLARVERGEWAMARPTIRHLRWLAEHSGVESIWSAAERATIPAVEPDMESDGPEGWTQLPAGSELA